MNAPASFRPTVTVVRVVSACLLFAGFPTSGLGQEAARPSTAAAIAQVFEGSEELLATGGVKCGTSLLGELSTRWGEVEPDSRLSVEAALQRIALQKDRISVRGYFRVHYDTTGFRQPALLLNNSSRIANSHEAYVDSVLAILEHTWDVEIGALGYVAPPPDAGKGGGPEYDVYVIPQPSDLFGATYWETDDLVASTPNERYATFMEIDNDYLGYRTPGMDGLRITSAHELFHAIQVGSYGIWKAEPKWDFYFYELSSSWMEEVVYDDVNDYLFDVRNYLTTSGGKGFRDLQGRALSFTTYGLPTAYYGYERCLFALYLETKFGRSVMREIWSSMRSNPFLISIASVLQARGTSFEREYSGFGFWNYFTADRADTLRYYPEGGLYPRIDPHVRMPYNGFYATVTTSGTPLSDQHFEFIGKGDTIHAAVINVDILGASRSEAPSAPLGITASTDDQDGMRQTLANGAHMSLSVERPADWRTLYLLSSAAADARTTGAPSPNPLSLRNAPVLTIPLDGETAETASVWVLSGSLDLVFSSEVPIVEQFGRRVARVSSTDLQSSVSTGIHFLVVRAGEHEFTWKIAIIQ